MVSHLMNLQGDLGDDTGQASNKRVEGLIQLAKESCSGVSETNFFRVDYAFVCQVGRLKKMTTWNNANEVVPCKKIENDLNSLFQMRVIVITFFIISVQLG